MDPEYHPVLADVIEMPRPADDGNAASVPPVDSAKDAYTQDELIAILKAHGVPVSPCPECQRPMAYSIIARGYQHVEDETPQCADWSRWAETLELACGSKAFALKHAESCGAAGDQSWKQVVEWMKRNGWAEC